ncbi:MAG: ATP-binding cassette domain-containing protein [Sandaracinus sp.]
MSVAIDLGGRAVVLRGVSFARPLSPAVFEGVDLSLAPGWTGLVGANGAGKTTLLALVGGELAPTAGSVERPPDAQVASIPQSIEAPPDDALARRDDRAAHRLRAALALVPEDLARWPTLSPGERRRWQIGAALAHEPDVLLVDEPTNHLDREGRALVLEALRRFRGIGVVVSHDRTLLDALTTRTVRLAAGGARAWSGGYSEARDAWTAEARALEVDRDEKRARLRGAARALDHARREHASAEAGRSTAKRMRSKYDSDARGIGATTKAMWAEGRAGRGVARRSHELARAEEALALTASLPRERGRALFVDFVPATRRAVLHLAQSEIAVAGRVLVRDAHLTLGSSDRIRLVGPNGAGKTTLVTRMLAGVEDPRLVFVPQDLDPRQTQRTIAGLQALSPLERNRATALLAALGADPGRFFRAHVGQPSPGEARQLAIAWGLVHRAHTLVLDEPTNDLDLPATERLEEALAAFPGALLIVTHDDALAARLSLGEWRLDPDGRVRARTGDAVSERCARASPRDPGSRTR